MKTRTVLLLIGAVVAALLAYPIYRLVTPWNEFRIADYAVRFNTLTGIAQIRIEDQWVSSFENDNYAPGLTAAQLQGVKIKNIAWGANGILCGEAANQTDHPIKGRLAFMIVVRDSGLKRAMPERSLRRTVDWQVGTTPFVLVTGMKTPDPTLRTALTLETMYDNENVSDTIPSPAAEPAPPVPPTLRK